METLGKITLGCIIVVIGFLISLLSTYVIISISKLYNLSFITQFSFLQIYGLLIVIGLVRYRYEKTEPDKDFSETIKDSTTKILTLTITIMAFWGLAFLAYKIIS